MSDSNAKRDAAAREHQNQIDEEFGSASLELEYDAFIKGYDFRDAEVAELRAQLKIKDEALSVAVKALEYYMDNCAVCAYELAGGDGAPSGYIPYDERWVKATQATHKINKLLGREKE